MSNTDNLFVKWVSGEVITANKLNSMLNSISDISSDVNDINNQMLTQQQIGSIIENEVSEFKSNFKIKQYGKNNAVDISSDQIVLADPISFESAISSCSDELSSIIKAIFPVGRIITMSDDTNPNDKLNKYGVYFVQFGTDQFLLGVGDNTTTGDTGGAKSYDLTFKLPNHSHSISSSNTSHIHTYSKIKTATKKLKTGSTKITVVDGTTNGTTLSTSLTSLAITSAGVDDIIETISTMPPYVVVKFWKVVPNNNLAN